MSKIVRIRFAFAERLLLILCILCILQILRRFHYHRLTERSATRDIPTNLHLCRYREVSA